MLPRILTSSVRTRLLVLAGVLGALWAIALIVAGFGLQSTNSSAGSAAHKFDTFASERDAYEGWLTQDDQSNMYAALASLHDASQQKLLDQTWQQVTDGRSQAQRTIAQVITDAPTARIAALAKQVRADIGAYSVFTQQMHQHVLAGDTTGAIKIVSVSNAVVSNRTQSDFDSLSKQLSAEATAVKSQVGSTVSSMMLILGLLALVTLITGGVVIAAIVRSITGPLSDITAGAERLAQGDLDVDVQVPGNNEVARMAAAFRGSVEHLRGMAGAAKQIAAGNLATQLTPKSDSDELGRAFVDMRERVASMIGAISDSSQSVSASAQQMASSSDESGRALTEIAEAISVVASGSADQVRAVGDAHQLASAMADASQRSARLAQETAAAAEDARTVTADGLAAADEAGAAMQAVRSTSAEASATIAALDAKSTEIGVIVATITRIAGQTNLLALNAAIEAARAGEQGQSFAVVADEVRQLAEESHEAADVIAGLIKEIQGETGRAVAAVQAGAARTEGGVETVERTRTALTRIGASVDGVGTRIAEISSAVEEIAASAGALRERIDTVAEVAHHADSSTQSVSASAEQTSAASQQIAAGAQELAATAERLSGLVSQFQLA